MTSLHDRPSRSRHAAAPEPPAREPSSSAGASAGDSAAAAGPGSRDSGVQMSGAPAASRPAGRAGEPGSPSWGARIHSVRFRVIAAMLGMMLAGLATAGLISLTVQFEDSDARTDQAILEKATNLVHLVQTTENRFAGDTMSQRLHEAAEDIEPRSNEVMAGIVNGAIDWTVEGNPSRDLITPGLTADLVRLRDPSGPAFGEFTTNERPFRVVVVPVAASAGPAPTFLLVGRDTADQREHNLASVRTYVLVSAGTLLAAAVFGSLVAGHLLRPLQRLRQATEVVSHDDLTQRVEVRDGADEVTLLAKTFNTMLERLDDGAQQQQRFLDDAGHELRTPLTILRGHLETVSIHDPADVSTTRDMLLDEVDRMQRLVDDLLLLANAGHPDFIRKEPIPVPEFLNQVMDKIRVLADRRWVLDQSPDCEVEADPQRLTQALVQLAANAVKYTGTTSTIALGARLEGPPASGAPGSTAAETAAAHAAPPSADTLLIWVRDDGIGIAEADQERIFERFGRAEPGRGDRGSGLGLAIVAAIAAAHGGTATVESAYGHGSSFQIRIPLQIVHSRL